jgi:hypothetical protein
MVSITWGRSCLFKAVQVSILLMERFFRFQKPQESFPYRMIPGFPGFEKIHPDELAGKEQNYVED